jgi:hypothetical protein
LTCGKTHASLLEQVGLWELATGGVLATDHSNQPEVGSHESLPSPLALGFECTQFLIGRIGKPGAGDPGMVRQQASLNRALQFHSFSARQQGFRYIVKGLGHVRHCAANWLLTTPVCIVRIDQVLSFYVAAEVRRRPRRPADNERLFPSRKVRKQLSLDCPDTDTGELRRGRIVPADRAHLADWLARQLACRGAAHLGFEGCTGWRYVAEELAPDLQVWELTRGSEMLLAAA